MKKTKSMVTRILPITFSIFIICFAILFSFYFKGLYYWDIDYLSIPQSAQMDKEQIKENYDVLIDYISNERTEKLVFPSFSMSPEGEIHFEDVKYIFTFIKRVMYILGLYSLLAIIINIMRKQYGFLKHTAIGILAGPLGLLALAMIDFDKSFVIFHQIAFSNDYWIFDPAIDPVIMILPQAFFLHSFLLIVGIILITASILTVLYKIANKKTNNLI